MDRWVGKVAVVTGASAGIGVAIVEDLVRSGLTVVGLARRSEKLEKLAASLREARGKFHGLKCDLRNEKDLVAAFKWANEALGGVDVLVNNAGVIAARKIIHDDTESFRKILETNVLATTISIREAVASMKKRGGRGYVINVNSVAGHSVPVSELPLSLYTASKFAVTALTETVRLELATEPDNKIKITSVSPGLVKTEMIEEFSPDTFEGMPCLEPRDIADAILYVLGTDDRVQVTELTIRPFRKDV